MNPESQMFENYVISARKRHIAYAIRFTNNADDAEDLLQEARIRAFRALPNVKGESIPEVWFRKIIRNCFLDFWRYKSRRHQTLSIDTLQENDPHFDIMDTSAPDPLDNIQKLDPNLTEAIDQLSPELKGLVMGSLSDLSNAELSETFKCPRGTVRSRLRRAHRDLKANLIKQGAVADRKSANDLPPRSLLAAR